MLQGEQISTIVANRSRVNQIINIDNIITISKSIKIPPKNRKPKEIKKNNRKN